MKCDCNNQDAWSPCAGRVNPVPDNSVTTDKILNDAITSDKIANDAITTDKIADGAITPEKLSGGGQIEDGSVTTAKLADGSVTNEKLAPEKGSFSVSFKTKTISPGYWQRIGDIVYFYVPNTSRFADQGGDDYFIFRPLEGQPNFPECYPKKLHFTRVVPNVQYEAFGSFSVAEGGQEASITLDGSFMQTFNTGTGRSSSTNGAYYWQYMTIQFTAMVKQEEGA